MIFNIKKYLLKKNSSFLEKKGHSYEKFFFVTFLSTLYFFANISLANYAFDIKTEGEKPITKFCIIGERCSGTNYMCALLEENLYIEEYTGYFGHKHFPIWVDLPYSYFEGEDAQFKGPKRYYTFESNEEFVFVFIFRNPYSWAKSLHHKPHHSSLDLRNIPFSTFIRKKWTLCYEDLGTNILYKQDPLVDLDPVTKQPFKNIFFLRSAKIKNMLALKNKVKNAYYINYEVAAENPEEVIQEFSEFFHIPMKPYFSPILYNKGVEKYGLYEKKDYLQISNQDLIYINNQLDEALEKKLGYDLDYIKPQ